MGDPVKDAAKLAELEAALGIVQLRHGDNHVTYASDTAAMRAELQRRIRIAGGVRRTRVRYPTQSSKGY